MREREAPRIPLPERALDRLLLGLGAVSLLAVVPMLWIWLLYGSNLSPAGIYASGIGLSGLTAAIGLAMIRILDEGR